MTISEIKLAAKNYLKANNIPYEAKNEGDECHLYVKQLNNLFYIEIHNRIFKRMLNPEDKDYPSQAGGFPCPCYTSYPSYRFVLDENGNVVIDLDRINSPCCENFVISLDEENIIVPVKNENSRYLNSQHFRIENGKGILINTFECSVISPERTLKSKLLITSRGLYNFETGLVLRDEFNRIIMDKEAVQLLAADWKIPENRREFIDTIVQKMEKENLIGGYKRIKVQKKDCEAVYHTFIFFDINGNFVSRLYYVDDSVLKAIDNISPENIREVFQQLEGILGLKVDEMIAAQLAAKKAEKEKKRKFLQQLKLEFMIIK